MGCLISTRQEIEAIRFVAFGTRPHTAEKIVRVDGLILAKLGKTTVACSRDLSKFAYLPGKTPWMEPVLKGLRLLGMISKEAMDAHLARCEERSAAEERRYAKGTLIDAAKTLGITLTAAQQKALQR
jgi:hypothetical protein